MAIAYATSMLPISQGALETSISTWRLLYIYIWHINILYTIPRTITSWSTETLLCPCMFLICPYFAPHPLACSYFVSSPSPVSPYCTPPLCASSYLPCLSLVCHLPCLSLLCPLWVSLSYVSHFVCPYLSPLCIPTSPPGVPFTSPPGVPCTCPQVFHFFQLGIGIDLVPTGHILRILFSQGVGVVEHNIFIYIYIFFFARLPPPE